MARAQARRSLLVQTIPDGLRGALLERIRPGTLRPGERLGIAGKMFATIS